MKDYVIGILIGVATTLIVVAPYRCDAQTQQFYGPQGQYVGQATTSGNTTYLYNGLGQNIGQITQQAAPLPIPTPLNTPPVYTPTLPSLTPIYDSIFGK